MNIERRNYRYEALICVVILAVLILGAVFGVTSPTSALAYGNDSTSVDRLVMSTSPEVVADPKASTNIIELLGSSSDVTSARKQGSYYVNGAFYSEGAFSNMSVGSDGREFRVGAAPSKPWYCDLTPSADLIQAIADPFITVRLSLVIETIQPDVTDGQGEPFTCEIAYYTGSRHPDTDEPIGTKITTPANMVMLGTQYTGFSPKSASVDLTNNYTDATDPFIRVTFDNWEVAPGVYSFAWRRVYLQVETEAVTGLEIDKEKVSVYDATGRRRNTDKDTLVKAGDIVVVDMLVKYAGTVLHLPQNSDLTRDDDKVVSGQYYYRKFVEGVDDTMLSYGYKTIHMTKLDRYTFPAEGDFPYKGTLDVSDDISGDIAIFQVKTTTDNFLPISVKTWRKDGVNTMTNCSFDLSMDSYNPGQPRLEANAATNVFYSKYIGTRGKAYYTDELSYVKEQKETSPGSGIFNDVITGINLTNGAVKPTFSSDATDIETYGSSVYIYYRALRINTIPEVTESSKGFEPSQGSLYCKIDAETKVAEYSPFILSLVTTDSGGNEVFNAGGNYSIEFIAVDEAGNMTINPAKQYMKVDVTDYEFTCQLVLGLGASEGSVINMSDATPYFAIVRDDGKWDTFRRYSQEDKISFKRGSKVVVRMKMSSAGYGKYVMTAFSTGGSVTMSTTNNTYSDYATEIIGGLGYTFEVNSSYSSDPSTRFMRFTFKQKAFISVTNTVQTYTGSGLKVMTSIRSSNSAEAETINGTVKVTYATSKDGEYTENLPVNQGIYYYKCELLNHSTYFATTETDGREHIFEIKPAVPQIEPNKMTVEDINYGQSLSAVDFIEATNNQSQQFNTHIKYVADSKLYSDRSADGIIGYYMLGMDKTSSAYKKPDAGEVEIKVTFVPIVTNADGTPYRTAQGLFVRNTNYSEVSFTMTLTVNRSTEALLTVEGLTAEGVVFKYDGVAKALSYGIVSTMEGEENGMDLSADAVVSYSLNGTDWTDDPPIDAGRYKVSVVLRSSSNYVAGDWTYDFIIEKKQLVVTAKDIVCDYQYEKEPSPVATDGVGNNRPTVSGLNYSFKYYYYDGTSDFSAVAIEENLVPAEQIFAGTNAPVNAGKYVVVTEIDETNYENVGVCYSVLTVNRVNGNNVNLNTKNMPTVKAIHGDSHINFLQPLKAAELATNSTTAVKYSYHNVTLDGRVRYEMTDVQGYFILSYRPFGSAGHEGESVEEYVADSREYLYDSIGRKVAYIVFLAEGAEANNFEPICREADITVGRAKPVFSSLTLDSIDYGAVVSSIDDLSFSGALRYATFGNEYMEVSPDDERYGYTATLNTTESRTYNAGSHYVEVRITPSGTDAENIDTVVHSFLLTVNKYTLTVTLGGENYSDADGAYVYSYGAVKLPSISYDKNVNVKRTETKYYKQGVEVVDVLTATEGAERYTAVFSVIDDNYQGTVEYDVKVNKADLYSSVLPQVYNASTVVAYNRRMDAVSFNSGVILADLNRDVTVSGRYYFDYPEGTLFADTGVSQRFNLHFVPDDSDNYNELVYDGSNNFFLTLTVAKENIGEDIEIIFNDTYTYGDLLSNVDLNTVATYRTSVWTNGTDYAFAPTEGYAYLNGNFVSDIRTNDTYLGAGEYSVTFVIDDANYRGEKTAVLTVNKKFAEIKVEEEDKVVDFNNMSQSIKYTVVSGGNVINESIAQQFSLYGEDLSYPPTAIGRYQVELTMHSSNYYAETVDTDFTIRLADNLISISNVDQVYSVPRQIAVAIRLVEAEYTVGYVEKLSDSYADDKLSGADEYTDLPTNAGSYWITLHFSAENNNGYEETIVYKNPLVISKYTATINVNDTINASYTGKKNNIRVTTVPYGLNYKIEYRRQGDSEYVSEEIFDANYDGGSHLVRVTVVDSNYQGTKTVVYKINPVALTEDAAPIFDTYSYNGSVAPAVKTAGIMRFGLNEVSGEFSLEVDEISSLSVGTHRVNYYFVATREDGSTDTNFLTYRGATNLVIAKREISPEDIVVGEVSGEHAEYNGSNFRVDSYIKSGVIYNPTANADLTLKTYYNGQATLPKEPGRYSVRVEVSSVNYSGSKTWEKEFVIDKGTPVIEIAPVANDGAVFSIGDGFSTSDIKVGSGRAVIKGTSTEVRGTFEATNKTFDKANKNDVTITFVPFDTTHFNSVVFNIKVNVLGTAPLGNVVEDGDWDGDITIGSGTVRLSLAYNGTPYYGLRAGDFSIVVGGDPSAVAEFNAFGIISIAEPDVVPNVGDSVRVTFTPLGTNADIYNIMHGYLSADIQKATLSDPEVSFIAYEGKPYADGSATVFAEGKVMDIAGTLALFDGDTPVDMTAVAVDGTYRYVYTTANYVDIEGTIVVSVKKHIAEDNIIVANLSKPFDGETILPSDLAVRVINVNTVVDYATDLSVTVYRDGVETDNVEVGEYVVEIRINNGVWYGEKTVPFEITKRDVSALLTLSHVSTAYGKVVAPTVNLDGQPIEGYTVSYKVKGAGDALYNGNLPREAGVYTVRVNVDSENYFGTATFDFTVEAKRVVLVTDPIHTYNYGNTGIPVVSFREEESSSSVTLDYGIYYYSATLSMSEENVLPVNAGTYTARVVLRDSNYSLGENGYAEFSYVINRLAISIYTNPTLISTVDGESSYHLKYGQKLSELAFFGGVAKYGDETIEGRFSVNHGDTVPEAGEYVAEFLFTPFDGNYATAIGDVSVTVAQASASVIFDNMQAQYDGSILSNALTYTVNPSSVRVKVTFYDSLGRAVDPVLAGSYVMEVSSLDRNYKVTSTAGHNGEQPVFVVSKSTSREVIDPIANKITVGDSLSKSTLTTGSNYGKVYYYGFNREVSGKFEFLEKSYTFKTAGTFTVGYIFTPDDIDNFAPYYGETTVEVGKALATITVENTNFVYSEGFVYPTFITNPNNLVIKHDITFAEYDPHSPEYIYRESDFVDVGVYYFTAWVEDENYYSEVKSFSITIEKKELTMDFVDSDGPVLQYLTTYGKIVDAEIKLYRDGTDGKSGYLIKDEVVDGVRIEDRYDIVYQSTEQGKNYSSHVAPTDIGVYKVTVTLRNRNYFAEEEVIYKIETGKIEEVFFDTYTMENQVYGAVVAPIVTTRPANVKYYIVYQGHETTLPTDAGSYHITVYFNDDNYEKLQASAMFKINKKTLSVSNIAVKDKVYDGIPNIEISGSLNGMMYGDEVSLRMTATTLDGAVNVGEHYVDITSYTLGGLKAGNYDLVRPKYNGKVTIFTKKVTMPNSGSFITSPSGFDSGTTVQFKRVDSEEHRATFFEKVTGRDSHVYGYDVQVNGADTIIKDSFKVYMAIPAEFLGEDFTVTGVGALSGQEVVFTREGDYITFYASSSGQIKFQKTEFRYEFVVLVAAAVIALVGIVVLIIANPLQRRSATSDGKAERAAIRRIKRGY